MGGREEAYNLTIVCTRTLWYSMRRGSGYEAITRILDRFGGDFPRVLAVDTLGSCRLAKVCRQTRCGLQGKTGVRLLTEPQDVWNCHVLRWGTLWEDQVWD